ncbi:hypothetical protein PVAP13_5NG264640 [Panicum virgatum]|uniref:Uncharacterized protein n=1 Tax=Panicum virgatum TaxID=38727 RepID=A0A8T0S0Q4_PANVG|nr:hypothetical protein PVAP13_5NG264640 [Panicum virgatum]
MSSSHTIIPIDSAKPREPPSHAWRPASSSPHRPNAASSNHIHIQQLAAAIASSTAAQQRPFLRRRASERRRPSFSCPFPRPPALVFVWPRARARRAIRGARARPPHGAAARYPEPYPLRRVPARAGGCGGEDGWRAAGG